MKNRANWNLEDVLREIDKVKFGDDVVVTEMNPDSDNPFDEVEVSRIPADQDSINARRSQYFQDFRYYAGYSMEPWNEYLEIINSWAYQKPFSKQTEETQTFINKLLDE